MNNRIPRFRNVEIDEICEGLIRRHEGDAYGTRPIDIVSFARDYFKLKLLYTSIAEEDPNKISFLADGVTPIRICYQDRIERVVIPEKIILLDRVLKRQSERTRRYFCIAHEVFHYIESVLTDSPVTAAFHTEFDREQRYSLSDFMSSMNIREIQADRGAAALLMPSAVLRNTCKLFARGNPICIYGDNIFTSKDKKILIDMAEYLGVSYTALTIRMKQLKMFENRQLDEYISTEMHESNKEAGG